MEYPYDLFIVYTATDASFVHRCLLPALELPRSRVLLIDELRLGEMIVPEIDRCVSSSRFTIVVLSPAYLQDWWATFGEQLASHVSIYSTRIIPLQLTHCKLPAHLRARVALDFTERANWNSEIARLRRVLRTTDSSPAVTPSTVPHRHECFDASFANTTNDQVSPIKTRCRIVIKADVKDFNADRLARTIEALRQLTGDISLQITDVEEGSVRLTVVLSPAAAKTLMELREKGQFAQLCGFDVTAVVELPSSEAIEGAVGAAVPVQPRRQSHVHELQYIEHRSLAVAAEPAVSLVLNWASGHDSYHDMVRARPKQPPKSRIDYAAEEAALACVRRGQPDEALKILLVAYKAPLTAFVSRALRDSELTSDVLQQVFLEAFQNIERFESRGSLLGWLYGIAYHCCLAERKHARRRATLADVYESDEFVQELVSMTGADPAKERALEDCLAKLEPSLRALVVMRFSFGLSYAELSEMTGTTPATVRVRISRVLLRLRQCVRRKGTDL